MTGAIWPPGDGEMAARIRGYDWAGATPLGPVEGWPQSLRTLVELMLATPQIATLAVGPERIFLYNDEASRHYGDRHPGVLGRPLTEAFPHEFGKVAPFCDQVFAGEGIHVPAQSLDPAGTGLPEVFDAYLAPVRDGDGRVIAAYMTGSVIGDWPRAEARLRESEARQADDLAGMRRLYDLHARLAVEADFGAALGEILAAAVVFTGTDRGCVQLVCGDGERLEMVAHRGHGAGSGFIEHFLKEGSKPAMNFIDIHARTAFIAGLSTANLTL